MKIILIDETTGKSQTLRMPAGDYFAIGTDPCRVSQVLKDPKKPGEVLVIFTGNDPQDLLPEPLRFMLDSTPCWCIAPKTMRPHIGWLHAKTCLELRAKVVKPKLVGGQA